MNSISCSGRLALNTMPFPSPVHVCADVDERYALPYPPVAKITMCDWNKCILPSSRHQARTPTHFPSSNIKSITKYSTKKSTSFFKD